MSFESFVNESAVAPAREVAVDPNRDVIPEQQALQRDLLNFYSFADADKKDDIFKNFIDYFYPWPEPDRALVVCALFSRKNRESFFLLPKDTIKKMISFLPTIVKSYSNRHDEVSSVLEQLFADLSIAEPQIFEATLSAVTRCQNQLPKAVLNEHLLAHLVHSLESETNDKFLLKKLKFADQLVKQFDQANFSRLVRNVLSALLVSDSPAIRKLALEIYLKGPEKLSNEDFAGLTQLLKPFLVQKPDFELLELFSLHAKKYQYADTKIVEESVLKPILSLLNRPVLNSKSVLISNLGNFLIDLQTKFGNETYVQLLNVYFDIPKKVKEMTDINQIAMVEQNVKSLSTLLKFTQNPGQKFKLLLQNVQELQYYAKKKAMIAMGSSLGDIALSIDPDEFEKTVFPLVSAEFLSSKTDNILKLSVGDTICKLLLALKPSLREENINLLIEFLTMDENKWRIRENIAFFIGPLSRSVSTATFTDMLVPCFFNLCQDNCAQVRKVACQNAHQIYSIAKSDPDILTTVKNFMMRFAIHSLHVNRVSFILMATSILENDGDLPAELFEELKNLANDKTKNVKLELAKLVNQVVNKQFKIEASLFEKFQALMTQLQ